MADREKVIKGLECCVSGSCNECPYQPDGLCDSTMMHDALFLFQEQKLMERKFAQGIKPRFRNGIPFCGDCDNVLASYYRNCPWCGCEVDW